jgi:flagellar protein FliO/FliZ
MRNIVLSLVILIFTWSPTFSQDKREDLDQLLKKELGIDPDKEESKKSNPNTADKDSDKSEVESNPIRERYNTDEDSSSSAWLLIKVIFVFGGLTFVMIYILKVMARTRSSKYPVQGAMSVLSSLAIGTNKQVQIIEVAGKLLVVGVGDNSVNLLTEITAIEEKDRILKQKEEFIPSQENFLVTLMETLKDFKPSGSERDSNATEKSYTSINDDELMEIEKKHKLTLERMKLRNKELGLDGGGSA